AFGSGPLSYQWQLNGQNIAGATSSVLTEPVANAGSYDVVVSNAIGSVTSPAATIGLGIGYSFTTLAGRTPIGSTNGAGTAARFNQPFAMVFDSSGNMYVADEYNDVIRKITPAGVVSNFAGTAGVAVTADGPLATATFNVPGSLAIDASGNFYVP